jgi:hypothetical protein
MSVQKVLKTRRRAQIRLRTSNKLMGPYNGWCRQLSMRRIVGAGLAVGYLLGVSSCSNGSSVLLPAKSQQQVLLVPIIDAGWAGWCMATQSEGGCASGRTRLPIVAETWEASSPPTVTMGYALTTSRVLSVSINGGSHIPTYADKALPGGLRAVAVRVPGLNPERERLPRFTPLNAKGDRILQPPGRGSEIRGETLAREVPIRNVKDPAHPMSDACRISSGDLPGLMAQGSSVITKIMAYSGLIGQGYISCASSSYSLSGWSLVACVLLDAAHPGSTPPPLPAMTPLQGHPGIFEAPGPEGSTPERMLFARRVRGAWLVVARAKREQRLMLLEHLRATAHL